MIRQTRSDEAARRLRSSPRHLRGARASRLSLRAHATKSSNGDGQENLTPIRGKTHMPGIVVEKRVVLLIGAFLASPAGAADKPVPFASPPPVVSASPPPVASIVPQSGFFLGLGATANSVNFDSQFVYGRGTSYTPAYYDAIGQLQPPMVGTAAGGTGFTLDEKTALAPVIQGGYFTHLYGTPWMGGVKFSYSYLGINSAYNDLLIPQSGGFNRGEYIPRLLETMSPNPTVRPSPTNCRSFHSLDNPSREALCTWEQDRRWPRQQRQLIGSQDLPTLSAYRRPSPA